MSDYTQTSKTIASCQITDGTLVSFHNDKPNQAGAINWLDSAGRIKYTMVISASDISNGYRMLLWNHYYLRGSIDLNSRVVPFLSYLSEQEYDEGFNGAIDENDTIDIPSTGGFSVKTVYPLYETICPAISSIRENSNANIVFWSNLKSGVTHNDNIYNAENVFKVSSYDYQKTITSKITRKMLCSATISFEMLRQSGGGFADKRLMFIPVIKSVKILSFSDGAIFDFSGGGGGIGRHSHESNSNSAGGYAYSVFAPGSSVKPISWI